MPREQLLAAAKTLIVPEDYDNIPGIGGAALIWINVRPDFWTPAADPEKESTPLKYVFVQNYLKPNPKWKMAGGHRLMNELHHVTALRELRGETGITDIERLSYAGFYKMRAIWKGGSIVREAHSRVVFVADVLAHNARDMHSNEPDIEGEAQLAITPAEFEQMVLDNEFLGQHVFYALDLEIIRNERIRRHLNPDEEGQRQQVA